MDAIQGLFTDWNNTQSWIAVGFLVGSFLLGVLTGIGIYMSKYKEANHRLLTNQKDLLSLETQLHHATDHLNIQKALNNESQKQRTLVQEQQANLENELIELRSQVKSYRRAADNNTDSQKYTDKIKKLENQVEDLGQQNVRLLKAMMEDIHHNNTAKEPKPGTQASDNSNIVDERIDHARKQIKMWLQTIGLNQIDDEINDLSMLEGLTTEMIDELQHAGIRSIQQISQLDDIVMRHVATIVGLSMLEIRDLDWVGQAYRLTKKS